MRWVLKPILSATTGGLFRNDLFRHHNLDVGFCFHNKLDVSGVFCEQRGGSATTGARWS